MRYSFDGATEADRHETQYFEMFCNRGIYHQGWTAVTRHSTPWVMGRSCLRSRTTSGSSTTPDDWSQAHDLAAEMPEKLAELQQLWLEEARKYNVLPLDDRRIERFNSELVGRPELVKGNSQLLFGGMGRLSENSVINIKNKSHAVTAEVVVPETGAEGVIIAQGGAFAGWSLYAKDGRRRTATTCSACSASRSRATRRSRRERTRCEWSSPTTAAALPRAAPSRSTSTATGRRGPGRGHHADDLLRRRDHRRRLRHRVAGQRRLHGENSVFTGTVNWVQIDLGEDAEDADHLITPEERLRVAMARQ